MGKIKTFILNVDFKDKDEAKGYGAKWPMYYNGKSRWFYKGEELPENLKKWFMALLPENEAKGKNENEHPEKNDIQGSSFENKASGNLYEKNRTEGSGNPCEKNRTEGSGNPYEKYKTVSEVNQMIEDIVYATQEFRIVFVKGEITGLNEQKSYYAFTVKEVKKDDSENKEEKYYLKCFFWKRDAQKILNFKLENAQQVALSGFINVFKSSSGGILQLNVTDIKNIGDGLDNLNYLELKKRLEAEGLFSPDRKKEIPKHPKAIGIVTSIKGKVIGDIKTEAKNRNPYVQLVLYHTLVQGANAAKEIVEGIKTLDRMGLDTIIIGRGGGSEEELSSYNDERVVRAVAEARTPIISAVGHDGDWTLADLAADVRKSTPTMAAEAAIPDVMAVIERIENKQNNLFRLMSSKLENLKLIVNEKQAQIEKNSPYAKLNEKMERLKSGLEKMELNLKNNYFRFANRLKAASDGIDRNIGLIYRDYKAKPDYYLERIRSIVNSGFERRVQKYNGSYDTLEALNPSKKLVGGFGYISKDDRPVGSIAMVNPGDEIMIKLSDGVIAANVTFVKEETE